MCTTTYFSQHDLAVLTRLLEASSAERRHAAPALRRLAALAGSSRLLDDAALRGAPQGRVALGTSVRYRVAGSAATESVVIACPEDPQALLARVPAMAPLGLGLLGHAEGCTVDVALALGRSVRLDILEVQPPVPRS